MYIVELESGKTRLFREFGEALRYAEKKLKDPDMKIFLALEEEYRPYEEKELKELIDKEGFAFLQLYEKAEDCCGQGVGIYTKFAYYTSQKETAEEIAKFNAEMAGYGQIKITQSRRGE